MRIVLKALLNRQSDEVQSFIAHILQSDVITGEERECFEFLEAALASGNTPTEQLFLHHFPKAQILLHDSPRLSVQDARAQFALVTKQRQRDRAGNRMAAIAGQVKQEGITDETWEMLRKLYSDTRKQASAIRPYNSLPTFREDYENRKHRSIGLLACVEPIDRAVGGMGYGTLTTIMGFVASFKTTWALNIAYNNAFQFGRNIAYMSFEVAREELLINFLSRHSYDLKFDKYSFIPHDRIRQVDLQSEEEEYLLNVIEPDFHAPPLEGEGKGMLYMLDRPQFLSCAIDDIFEKMVEIDNHCHQTTGRGIDAFVWDHIQMFKFSDDHTSRRRDEYAVMNAYTNQFMQWALDFRGRKTIQLLLAQTNREGWRKAARNGGVYDLTALAEVNEVERASSRILSVYTDDALKASGEAKVQVLKNRYGRTLADPITTFVQPECALFGVDNFDQLMPEDLSAAMSALFSSDDF